MRVLNFEKRLRPNSKNPRPPRGLSSSSAMRIRDPSKWYLPAQMLIINLTINLGLLRKARTGQGLISKTLNILGMWG